MLQLLFPKANQYISFIVLHRHKVIVVCDALSTLCNEVCLITVPGFPGIISSHLSYKQTEKIDTVYNILIGYCSNIVTLQEFNFGYHSNMISDLC